MRERPLKFYVIIFISLFVLTGCKSSSDSNAKKSETRPYSRELENSGNDAQRPSEREFKKFVIKEIPVEQEDVQLPDHVIRVNRKVISLVKNGQPDNSAISKLWQRYYGEILLSDRMMRTIGLNTEVQSILSSALKKEIFAELSSPSDETLLPDDRESLYGCYMSIVLSASSGAETLDGFFVQRADDSEVREIDVYLYRMVIGSLEHLKKTEKSPRLNHWQSYAQLKNPIFRVLALQMGDQFYPNNISFNEINISERRSEIHQGRGLFYANFLDDDLKFIRVEALRNIAALQWDIAKPILVTHKNGRFGIVDKAEINNLIESKVSK